MKRWLYDALGAVILFCLLGLIALGILRLGQHLAIFPPATYVVSPDETMPADPHSVQALKNLINEGHLISVTAVYQRTLDYYDRLFSILIALLGILGAVSFMYIRTSSGEKAREDVQKSVEEHLQKQAFLDRINEEVLKPKLNEFRDQLSKIQEIVEVLDQKKVAKTILKKSPKKKKKILP